MDQYLRLLADFGTDATIASDLLALSGAVFLLYLLAIGVLVAWQKVRGR